MGDLESEDNLDAALITAGFGCFNIIVGSIGLFVAMAIIFCTTSFSYAMTSMQCELSLTNLEKGRLNSMAYLGMIAGALVWALISDNLGRRPVIILSHAGDAIFGNILAFSQQYTVICICKFLCGLCISGGYSSFLTYLAEVTLSSKRTPMMFVLGITLNISSGVLPIMAILILPRQFKIDDNFSFPSWQIFLSLASIPSIVVAIAFLFMPESPKFDIHQGNEDRAMNTLQKIFVLNRKRDLEIPDVGVNKTVEKSPLFDFKTMVQSVKKHHLIALSLLVIIEVCILMCQNTIRLWQPTLVKIVEDQGHLTFCGVINEANNPVTPMPTTVSPDGSTESPEKQCVTQVTASSFHGNLYIFLICLDGFIIAILLAGHYDVKKMLVSAIIMSSIFTCCLLIARSYFGLLSLLGLYLCAEYISAMAVNNIAVLYFPTVVRNTFLAFILFAGRVGSSVGNQILPPLMALGCQYLFAWLLTAAFITVVVTILLPNPKKLKQIIMKLSDTMATPIEEKLDQNLKVRTGMVHVSDGKCRPEPQRLNLTMELLSLQKLEVVTPSSSSHHNGPPMESKERMVQITRQKQGGLGLSIKGGAEHKLPILISRIYKDQAADITGQLFVGDAIIKVNGEYITACPHDDAVNILRNAGDIVVLTVKHYRAATPFLQKQLTKDTPDSDNDVTCAELKADEGYKSSVNSGTISRSCSRPMSICSEPEKRWTDVVTVPLMMAYVTRYIYGTDKLRQNAFEVRGLNGVTTGVIHCDELAILSQWLKLITDNVVGLTHLQMKLYNRNFAVGERIEYMGWVNEGVINNNISWQSYKPRFLLLKGTEVMLFETPPLNVAGISKALVVYKVYQTMFRIVKESETVDSRQHCFLLQSSGHEPRYLSVETRQELLRIENSWNAAIVTSVIKLGRKTFAVSHHGKSGGLTLDWQAGFSLAEGSDSSIVWHYKFSQLRGSSDDGKSKLKLHFQDHDSRVIETKELECQVLQSLLFCMHAFLTAKVASVDPAFLSSIQQT